MKIKNILLILATFVFTSNMLAQDKLVLKNGNKVHCKIVSLNIHTISYKDSVNGENIITIPKNEVLMAEYSKSGSVYIFGDEESAKTQTVTNLGMTYAERMQKIREKEKALPNNIIGIQFPDLLMGKLTLTYERLFLDKQLGIVIPFSLTYDMKAIVYPGVKDTTANGLKIRRNVGFMTGIDINYYFETRSPRTKFFVGPRFRYGTDVFMFNITGYTVQFQNGFLFSGASGKTTGTLALGFGFVKILSSPAGGGLSKNQGFPWMSITYRLGFRL